MLSSVMEVTGVYHQNSAYYLDENGHNVSLILPNKISNCMHTLDELIRSKKQLTSYAGLDVREKQSGTSVNGKSRISKKGNRSLRKTMYLPCLSAVKWDDPFKSVYARIVSRSGIKLKGLVAVQRKMLEMIYTLYKSRNKYDKVFLIKEDSAQIQNV